MVVIFIFSLLIPHVNSWIHGPSATSYSQAKAYCESLGTYLATITDDTDHGDTKSLCSTIDSNAPGCWIGLFYDDTTWQWVDGSALDYGFLGSNPSGSNPWASGEPNNHEGDAEDCVHLYASRQYNWNDASCSDNNYPICNDPPTSS